LFILISKLTDDPRLAANDIHFGGENIPDSVADFRNKAERLRHLQDEIVETSTAICANIRTNAKTARE
jgi:hypothetical protein